MSFMFWSLFRDIVIIALTSFKSLCCGGESCLLCFNSVLAVTWSSVMSMSLSHHDMGWPI